MKFENIRVYNFENALRGMRNPKNSWSKSDSLFGIAAYNDLNKKWLLEAFYYKWLNKNTSLLAEKPKMSMQEVYSSLIDYSKFNKDIYLYIDPQKNYCEYAIIGPKDMKLATTLIKGGSEHRKFLRQIFVSVDITAPLFWWKEFDTYKVGTVVNSTSTMHTITNKPITLQNFEIDDYFNVDFPVEEQTNKQFPYDLNIVEEGIIPYLEYLRQKYLEAKNNDQDNDAVIYWKELIRWLPESWLQKRTVTLNYENLLAICSPGQRRFHKLAEWSFNDDNDLNRQSFIRFVRQLPYAQDFIFIDEIDKTIVRYFETIN